MFEMKDPVIGSGSVQFNKEYKGSPTTSETIENVTINNIGSPSIKSHYEVSFALQANFIFDGIEQFNIFNLSCIVPNEDQNAAYRTIEAAAAKQIPLMLRALADGIENEIAEFDHKAKGE